MTPPSFYLTKLAFFVFYCIIQISYEEIAMVITDTFLMFFLLAALVVILSVRFYPITTRAGWIKRTVTVALLVHLTLFSYIYGFTTIDPSLCSEVVHQIIWHPWGFTFLQVIFICIGLICAILCAFEQFHEV